MDASDLRLKTWVVVNSQNLREYARNILITNTIDHYVVPWAAERPDDAKANLLQTNNDLDYEARKRAEAHANIDAQSYYESTTGHSPNLRPNTVNVLTTRLLPSITARSGAVKRKLKNRWRPTSPPSPITSRSILRNARPMPSAQAAADKSVFALTRSSAKANKGKACHDPIQRRSRSSSVAPSPSQSPSLGVVALPTTPEITVHELMESAPIETTPIIESTPPPSAPTDFASMMQATQASNAAQMLSLTESMRSSTASVNP